MYPGSQIKSKTFEPFSIINYHQLFLEFTIVNTRVTSKLQTYSMEKHRVD